MRSLSACLSRLPISAPGALVAFVIVAAGGAVVFTAVRGVRTTSAARQARAAAEEVEEAEGGGEAEPPNIRPRGLGFQFVERSMPGEVEGQLRSRWLAPYVSVTDRLVGPANTTTVRWFTPEGKLARELAGPEVNVQAGFLYEGREGGIRVHAINGDWAFDVTWKGVPSGSITCTEDGRTFAYEFHPREGEIAADVYVRGKLAGTLGPFPQHQGAGAGISLSDYPIRWLKRPVGTGTRHRLLWVRGG